MRQKIEYDALRDIMPVSQTGFVDLAKANATSEIDVPVAVEDERYNGIENPNSIGERPSDVFEQMQANKTIVDFQLPQQEETSK